jgi:hypothetical protein
MNPGPGPGPGPTPPGELPPGAIMPGAYFLIALTAQNLICRADAANVYVYCVEGAGDTDFEQFQVFRPTGTSTSPIVIGESVSPLHILGSVMSCRLAVRARCLQGVGCVGPGHLARRRPAEPAAPPPPRPRAQVIIKARGTTRWCRMSLMVSGKQGILCDMTAQGSATVFAHTAYGLTFNNRPLIVDGPGFPLYLGGAGAKSAGFAESKRTDLVSLPSPSPSPVAASPAPRAAVPPSPKPPRPPPRPPGKRSPPISRSSRRPPPRYRTKSPPSALSKTVKAPPPSKAVALMVPPPRPPPRAPTGPPPKKPPPSPPRITQIVKLPNGTIVYNG